MKVFMAALATGDLQRKRHPVPAERALNGLGLNHAMWMLEQILEGGASPGPRPIAGWDGRSVCSASMEI